MDLDREPGADLEEVHVVWHKGYKPVLRVGQGHIRDVLEDLRRQLDLIEASKHSDLHVTWTEVDAPRAVQAGSPLPPGQPVAPGARLPLA